MKNENKKVHKPNLTPEDKKRSSNPKQDDTDTAFPGYPHYPSSEDVFNQEIELDLDPDELTIKNRTPLDGPNEKDFYDDMTGEDLDIPGSDADELENNAGYEDEENNYYSLGGDAHNDLEEDRPTPPQKRK